MKGSPTGCAWAAQPYRTSWQRSSALGILETNILGFGDGWEQPSVMGGGGVGLWWRVGGGSTVQ
jgi:hypothetical protein